MEANKLEQNDQVLSPRDMELRSNKGVRSGIRKRDNAAAINNEHLEESYLKILKIIREQLNTRDRYLSYIFHNKFIESLFSILSLTIFRPNAVLVGSVLLFATSIGLYVFKSITNYSVSGSELIIAFSVGWMSGMIFDYIKKLNGKL